MILGLDEQTFVLATLVDHAGGHGVDIAAKLGESFELAELCLVDLEGAGHFFIDLICALPPTRDTEIPTLMAGSDASVEESCLKEDLTVGDGDYIGGDVGRHVACLSFDDGEGGERASTLYNRFEAGVVHLLRPLPDCR